MLSNDGGDYDDCGDDYDVVPIYACRCVCEVDD